MERLKNKMQFITTTAKTAFANFRRNKVRTFLTSLGILIGVASVVLLMAVGTGLKNYIQNQFESLGTNLLTVVPGQILQNGSFRTSGGAASLTGIEFDEKDVIRLKRINGAQMVVPIFTKSLTASTGNKSEYSSLYAGTEEIFPSRNLSAQFGTVFTRTDNSKRSKVVVLGPKLADKLFGDESHAIGRTIQLENQTYRVKGVLKPKGGGGFGGSGAVPNPVVSEPTIEDTDGDGSPDNLDACPNTVSGVSVNANGCVPGQNEIKVSCVSSDFKRTRVLIGIDATPVAKACGLTGKWGVDVFRTTPTTATSGGVAGAENLPAPRDACSQIVPGLKSGTDVHRVYCGLNDNWYYVTYNAKLKQQAK